MMNISAAWMLCTVVVVTIIPTIAISFVGAATSTTSSSTKNPPSFYSRHHATNSRATIAGFCSNGGIRCKNRSPSGRNVLGRRGKITHGGPTGTRLSSTNRNSHFQYRVSSLFSKPTNKRENAPQNNPPQDHHNWSSQTMAIALPALAGMMTNPLLSMVDTLFVGRLGHTSSTATNGVRSTSSSSSIPLAALGACTSIFHLSFHCFRATTMSTSSLVAGALARDEQRKEQGANEDIVGDGDDDAIIDSSGAYNQKEAVLIAQTSIQQALITGSIITAFLLAFGPKCLITMGIPSPTSPTGSNAVESQLYPSALTYLNHRSLAAPAVVVLSAAEGIFCGYGNVITPWKASCVVALLNLVLDPFCMFGRRGGGRIAGKVGATVGLGMGIKGAAVATAFSQACGAILYGRWLLRKGMLGGGGKNDKKEEEGDDDDNDDDARRQQQRWNKAALIRRKRTIAASILRANAAMMAKQGSLLLGWAYATSRATRMGHAVVASHQMVLSVWLVVALVLEGVGVATVKVMDKTALTWNKITYKTYLQLSEGSEETK